MKKKQTIGAKVKDALAHDRQLASLLTMRVALDRELENNKALTAQLLKKDKTINDQESAFRGQEATIRQLRECAERDAKLIADKINQINHVNNLVSQWQEDARTSDQNTALVQAKYEAAMEIIKAITGRDTF